LYVLEKHIGMTKIKRSS